MHRNNAHSLLSSVLVSIMLLSSPALSAGERQTVTAAYIPLADHYAAIVAYEKYRDQMQLAEFRIERMKSWPLLRAFFLSGESGSSLRHEPARHGHVSRESELPLDRAHAPRRQCACHQ